MKKEVLKIFFKPLSMVNQWIPKKDHLIFFYSNLGFRDNVKAMFDYLISHGYQEKYQIVCAINEAEKYKKLQQLYPKRYQNVTFVSCKKGISYFLRCRVGFYCFGKYPIKPAKTQTIINLWHGVPIKKIGNMEEQFQKVDYNFFTYLLTTSEFYAPIMEQSFSCGPEQILIEGQPRNDELFYPLTEKEQQWKKQWEKVIVWLPTYRNTESLDQERDAWPVPVLSVKEAEELNAYLEKKNCHLIIKLHPLQYGENLKQFSQIEVLTQKMLEEQFDSLYQLLKAADGLITDYSSVYFDYMLLDRPIGFTVDDIENYSNSRGFVFEHPKDFMPGRMIDTKEDMLYFIEDVIQGTDSFAQERQKVNDLVNRYKDGRSSERIAERFIQNHESLS